MKIITYPTTEPVTLSEARLHLRLDAYDSPATHPDDTLIQALISAARDWAEKFTGRSICRRVVEVGLDRFPGACWNGLTCRQVGYDPEPIVLPGGPVQSILSVVYVTTDGQQTLTDYQLDTNQEPATLWPAAGVSWPSTKDYQKDAVRVRYQVGYDLAGDSPNQYPLPLPIKQAILLVVGSLYENREATAPIEIKAVPMTAEFLLRPYRVDTSIA